MNTIRYKISPPTGRHGVPRIETRGVSAQSNDTNNYVQLYDTKAVNGNIKLELIIINTKFI